MHMNNFLWQKARQDMNAFLKSQLPGYPDSTIEDLNDKLFFSANSMEAYMDQSTLFDRVAAIIAVKFEPQSLPSSSVLPTHGMPDDLCDFSYSDFGDNFMELITNNGLSHSNYYGESSHTTILQTDGMVSIPNAGTSTTLQHQPANYSLLDNPSGFTARSYGDYQMPSLRGGNGYGATQNGNFADSYVPSVRAPLQDFDQTYSHQGGLNYPMGTFQGNHPMGTFQGNHPMGTFQRNHPMGTFQGNHQGTVQRPAPPNSALQTSYTYAPTGQPSMDQRSYETGMNSNQQRLQKNESTKSARGRPRSKGVSAGCSQATVCESKCEYCGKNPPLVDFFLKRTEKSFREQYPKLCKKLEKLSRHLKKCKNESCGCSRFRPYYQHSDNLLDGFKKLQVSRKIAPHPLKSMRSTREISDGGDAGEFSRKIMRADHGFGPVCASVDQTTSQVGVSQMGNFNETVFKESITSWGCSAYPAHDNGNFYEAPMSLDDHDQGLKTDGTSQTESPSSVLKFYDNAYMEPVLKAGISSLGD